MTLALDDPSGQTGSLARMSFPDHNWQYSPSIGLRSDLRHWRLGMALASPEAAGELGAGNQANGGAL